MARKSKLSAEAKIVQGLEGFAAALEKDEDLEARFTCRKVSLKIEPCAYTPKRVKAVRQMLGLSQALFAQFIGASTNSVQAWEQGERSPSPMACRFMDEIAHAPGAFRERFMNLASSAGAGSH